ncbi:MAG TPA: class I SAM-dependent methyltransferase [Pseudonocardiaceae bacterium]|jgi:trans-aconitate methyltransferase|nr:class I SAM-dependent methyltransferase [Pseudonocardiaceae bacterium]
MGLGFSGDVVDFYHRYRRGYPAAAIDAVVAAFGLTRQDVAVDLGCGTGQVARPLAARVRAVLGVDPEPDMLTRARQAAGEAGVANLTWLVGADTDVPAIRALLGDGSVGAVTIGQALHWMDHERLFRDLVPLVRPGGGVAVLTNGTPLWLQDSDWSRALRSWLEDRLHTRLTNACGTDEAAQRRYRDALAGTGYRVDTSVVDYAGTLDVADVVGGVFSAMMLDQLPAPEDRAGVADQIRQVLAPHGPCVERVRVSIVTGRRE